MITYHFINAEKEPIEPCSSQLDQIIRLYRDAGWWERDTDNHDRLIRLIKGSHCFMVALQQNEVVGMGRAISDRASDAYIQDVTVNDTLRHQGIGSLIVEKLVQRLQQDGIVWIGLIAEKDSHLFYERLGFRPMVNAVALLKLDV